ncbi:unnamed protein product [Caenorhabditis bovis]|uniref:Protein FRA10AC1 n=1 Tax=Caenorhabditis bovis TaxID=2654633 RepID=A0A8S1FE86_9PELO|nr:unnamed protein product [Caenorhabditis bovis]
MDFKRNPRYGIDDLQSEFDEQSDVERKRKRTDFLEKEYPGEVPKQKRKDAKHWFQDEHSRMHKKMGRMMSMNAYQRHKEIINMYYLSFPGSTKMLQPSTSHERTDYDVLKDNHKFVWSAEDEANAEKSWETRMAKRYYDKLFKEYCIVDLSLYKKNKIAMRWRTEKEVKDGKGQFQCGNRKCENSDDLKSWEVNFAYKENDQRKNELVKVRLCPECSEKLNYGSKKRQVEKKKILRRWERQRQHKDIKPSANDDDESKPINESDSKSDSATSEEKNKQTSVSSSDIWEAPVQKEIEKTVDEDIDDFLDDLFQ